jgi:hypothetical protein
MAAQMGGIDCGGEIAGIPDEGGGAGRIEARNMNSLFTLRAKAIILRPYAARY